jgi:hypothetical protein
MSDAGGAEMAQPAKTAAAATVSPATRLSTASSAESLDLLEHFLPAAADRCLSLSCLSLVKLLVE